MCFNDRIKCFVNVQASIANDIARTPAGCRAMAFKGGHGYYMAHKPIASPCILCMFVRMKFINYHSCVLFVMKSTRTCITIILSE